MAATVVALDQVVKALVTAFLGEGAPRQSIDLLGAFLSLEYVENRGAAFGFFSNQGPALAILAVLVLSGLTWYYTQQRAATPWLMIGVGFIAGGAIGNLTDRLRFGFVVDFIAVGPWPRFNVADAAITFGVVCLVAHGIREDRDLVVGEDAKVTMKTLDVGHPGSAREHHAATAASHDSCSTLDRIQNG